MFVKVFFLCLLIFILYHHPTSGQGKCCNQNVNCINTVISLDLAS